MAEADWKRTTEYDGDLIIWEKKGGEDRVAVSKMLSEKIIANPIKSKYTWVVTTGFNTAVAYTTFKEKEDAIRYAKKYMRSH